MSLFKVDVMEKGEAAGSDASLAWWPIALAFWEILPQVIAADLIGGRELQHDMICES